MTRPSCKDRILDAADAVASEFGATKLTLDAVAERAEVSKGGVLYHFPTKEALLVGMVARHIEQARQRQASCLASCTGPAAGLKVDILSTLERTPENTRVSAALLAAVANEPKLLEPAIAFHAERFARLAGTGADEAFARKALVPLAGDGLLFHELLQLSPFSVEQRKALVAALLKIAEEVCADESAHEA
jgi:AcrR family transcriptional regulator